MSFFNNKKYLANIKEIEKDMDFKKDPSEIDHDMKDMLCEIKRIF